MKYPVGLADGGRTLYRAVSSGRELRPDESRLLLDAARECDLIDAMQAALSAAPLIVKGSTGQEVVNPLVSELRQHRATLNALLRALSLADSDTSAAEGAHAAREAAVALARARWDRKRPA